MNEDRELRAVQCKRCGRQYWTDLGRAGWCQDCCDRQKAAIAHGKNRKRRNAGQRSLWGADDATNGN